MAAVNWPMARAAPRTIESNEVVTKKTALPSQRMGAAVRLSSAAASEVGSVRNSRDASIGIRVNATISDTVIVVDIVANADRFIQSGTDDISTRIDWFEPANVFFPNWFSNTDQIKWEMTP